MKVKIRNKITNLKETIPDWTKDSEWFCLELLEEKIIYTVYAVCFCEKPWFYLCCENIILQVYPYYLFDIMESTPSKLWSMNVQQTDGGKYRTFLAYKEWAKNPDDHVCALYEGYEYETGIFLKYKKIMDFEFPDPFISMSAEIIKENWLYCPKCFNGWQTDSRAGMIKCPECKTIMRNPNYIDR